MGFIFGGILAFVMIAVMLTGYFSDRQMYSCVYNKPVHIKTPGMIVKPSLTFPRPGMTFQEEKDGGKITIPRDVIKSMKIMMLPDYLKQDEKSSHCYLCCEPVSTKNVQKKLGVSGYPYTLVGQRHDSVAPYLCMAAHSWFNISADQMHSAFEFAIPEIMNLQIIQKIRGLKDYPGDDQVLEDYKRAYFAYMANNKIPGVKYNTVVYYFYDARVTGNLKFMFDNLESFKYHVRYSFEV